MIDLEKKVSDFHAKAKIGDLSECKKCPRNPANAKTIYASTCTEHFKPNKNGLIIIMRDPGGEGAAKTQKLCPICNLDKSASKFTKLFNQIEIPHSNIQFCNAVLHGFEGKNVKPSELEINCCKRVVADLFEILSPKIVFALGKEALETSFEILSMGRRIKASVNLWVKNNFYFGKFNSTHLFSMPHISHCIPNLRNFGLTAKEVDEVFLTVPDIITKFY